MKRRNFVAGVLLAATIPHAQAQQHSKVYRLAFAAPTTPVTEMNEASGHPVYQALFEELKRLGYVEGRNLVVERYSGEGRAENYPELARRVVHSIPDIILIVTGRLTRFFKDATAAIPIVAMTADPIALGIATSLARPDGNITGVVVDAGQQIEGKRVELLKEVVPGASRVAYITSRAMWETPYGAEAHDAARRLLPQTKALGEARSDAICRTGQRSHVREISRAKAGEIGGFAWQTLHARSRKRRRGLPHQDQPWGDRLCRVWFRP
jgi:putative ABC transport system substrate-binding protein